MLNIQWNLLYFLVFHLIVAVSCAESKCGYSKCPKLDPTKLNVHLIPHTHDDVGWLKTVDQYYYGNNRAQSPEGVQYILDSVIEELQDDPNKRFIYVEMAFFWKWWNQQNDDTKMLVKQLVQNGNLII